MLSSMKAEQRKIVRLNRSGGSRSVTLPKTWLRRIGLGDDSERAELVLTEDRITIEPLVAEPQSFEEDPAFAEFMNFMLQSALLHPEALVNAADVFAEDEDLVPPRKQAKAGM
jgi:antitoxin component of MazEF toxin-antitoxin module